MRVAIIGAGAAGSSCAWQLLSQAAKQQKQVSVTLFEMGRGAGGRCATRRSRDLPGAAGLNHGAPLFHLRRDPDPGVAPLVQALLQSGHMERWNGTAGCFDVTTAESRCTGTASRGQPTDEAEQFDLFVGKPGMSKLADGILQLAGGLGSLETRFNTKISVIQPSTQGVGWSLFQQDGTALGEFDWLVVTSASLAHPRWRQTFGEEPPMLKAAREVDSPKLGEAVQHVGALRFEGAQVAMLAWALEGDATGGIAETFAALPFDVMDVAGDAVLAKVVRQSSAAPYALLVLHSTAEFAQKYADVFSGSGTTARVGTKTASAEQEAAVGAELYAAFERLLRDGLNAPLPPPPSWGPVLHRWGSAFCEGDSGAAGAAAWIVDDAQAVFAGDFIAPPFSCVETALRSGVTAGTELVARLPAATEGGDAGAECEPRESATTDEARQQRIAAAERYVQLLNEQDHAGMLEILTGCDFFGEPANENSVERYFDVFPELHVEVTSLSDVTGADGPALELQYTRTWRQLASADDGCELRLRSSATERLLFVESSVSGVAAAKIRSVRYAAGPSEPAPVEAGGR